MNMRDFKSDWRNMGQMDYLFKKRFRVICYTKDLGDHEHCEFCSEKISYMPNSYNIGYYSIDTEYRYWICSKCYDDFKEIFQWSLET